MCLWVSPPVVSGCLAVWLWPPPGPPHCLLVFCRWGRRRVYHARLRVQVAGAAAVVTAVCPWVSPPAVCLAAWLLLRLGRVDLAPLSSVLAAGAVEHCGSADASAAGSLACGVEEDAVLTSLWRRQRGLQSVAAVVPVLDGLVAAAAAVVVVGVAGVAVLLHAVCGAISCGCSCWGCLLVCVVRLAVAEGWGADAGPCFCVCFRGWLAVGVLLYGGWYFLTRRGLWLQCWGLAWSGLLPCLCRWVEWLRWLQRWRLQV